MTIANYDAHMEENSMIQSEAWPRDKHRTYSAFPLQNVSPGLESDVYQKAVYYYCLVIASVSI